MELVYTEAKKHTNYPSTIAGICLTESSLGKNKYNKEGSLGIMQLQVATVKDVIRWYPRSLGWMKKLEDYQIASHLLNDDRLSVEIATKLWEFHRKRHNYFGAISRYNGGANNVPYFKRVEKNKRRILRWKVD